MRNKMNTELDSILGDDNNKNNKPMNDLEKTLQLLEEMRIEFSHQMETVLKPVYKKEHDPIDVLLLPDLTRLDKLILIILRNRESATLAQLIMLTSSGKQVCNTSLNKLRNLGYVVKLRVSTYKLNETKIY